MTERQNVDSNSRPKESFGAKIAAVCGSWYYRSAELNDFLSGRSGGVSQARQPSATSDSVIVIRLE